MLDRRKNGVFDSSSMTEDERSGLSQQLMALVARLEEELFQAEAHKFEAEASPSLMHLIYMQPNLYSSDSLQMDPLQVCLPAFKIQLCRV